MTNPYPLMRFGFDDTRIKNDINGYIPAGGNPILFENRALNINLMSNDFTIGARIVVPVATYEPNHWVLDGNYHFAKNEAGYGYFGTILSDAFGNVTSDNFKIPFLTAVTTTQITFHFDEFAEPSEWASSITLTFYASDGTTVIATRTISPNSTVYTDVYTVSNYYYLKIAFNITNTAYRFSKLTMIDFNFVNYINTTQIKSAAITEEFSPIIETLTANKVTVDLISDNSNYSVTNPLSAFSGLANRMPFRIYEVINNYENFMGIYYLDSWQNHINSRQVTFVMLDAIGILAKSTFYGWLDNTFTKLGTPMNTLASFLNAMTTQTGVPNNQSGLAQIVFLGNIEPLTWRDAIQQICFAIGFSPVTWLGNSITFLGTFSLYQIGNDNISPILITQEVIEEVGLSPIVTQVNASLNVLVCATSGTPATIYSASLAVGNYLLKLAQPVSQPTISGGSWNAPTNWYYYGGYYLSFTVSSPGTVTIQALATPTSSQIDSASYANPSAPANTAPLEIDINLSLSQEGDYVGSTPLSMLSIATWLNSYYGYRNFQKSIVFNQIVHAGYQLTVDSVDGKVIHGFCEESEITLVGLRSEIKVVGYSQ